MPMEVRAPPHYYYYYYYYLILLSRVGCITRQITSRRSEYSEFIPHSLLQLHKYCRLQYHNHISCWSHCHALDATQLVAAGLHWTRWFHDPHSLLSANARLQLTRYSLSSNSYKPSVGQWKTHLVSLLRCHRVHRLPSNSRFTGCLVAWRRVYRCW
jgi:hypothetical protein